MAYRLGVDIGGTFTDAILMDEVTGGITIAKVPSTPADLSCGFLQAARHVFSAAAVAPAELSFVMHATTVATNAIIEGKTGRAAFITTEGFRDMLEIARQIRPSLYDLHFEKPRPLVPRHLCFGIRERLNQSGDVILPVDEDGLREVAGRLHQRGVESIAVCLLHSYANSRHEKKVAEILRQVLPDVMISISSDVCPEFREYSRACTTVINASLRPVVVRYLRTLEMELRREGVRGELLMMQSSGGVYSFASAVDKPVFMVESGPAAGVVDTVYLAGVLGYKNVLSFDMGGTTAKVGLIQNGTPHVTKEYEVGSAARRSETNPAAGYPIRTPVIDLVEIGAGGGSIAWVDRGGALRVGPQSSGADPGPACYGKGGVEPTVTDANLVLGRLNPEYFLGGAIRLDVEAARRAIGERCADRLGLDVVAAACGIVEIANAAMANALRLVSIQRGYDPRDFALIGFGGAGPLHANRIGTELEIPTAIIPASPGLASALGLVLTDLKHDYHTTMLRRTDQLDLKEVEQAYRILEDEGRSRLEQDGITPEQMTFLRIAEMRYVGQSYELSVPLPAGQLGPAERMGVEEHFRNEHLRTYGFSDPNEPIELVNLRLSAIGNIAKPPLREIVSKGDDGAVARKGERAVYFEESQGFVSCPIYDRYRLGARIIVLGPAIVEEMDSTTVIHPGYKAMIDHYGNLILTRATKGGL